MENLDLFDKLVIFIIDLYPCLENDLINEETGIEEDLKITGDEAIEFIIKFGKQYNVDISNFLFDEYFKGEGEDMDVINPILVFLKLKKEKRKKDKELTVGNLIAAIKAGKLNEEVINPSIEI